MHLVLGEVGHDSAHGAGRARFEGVDRQVRGYDPAAALHETDFTSPGRAVIVMDEVLVGDEIVAEHEAIHRRPNDFVERGVEHRGKAAIRVDDDAVRGHDRRAFIHRLHQDAVRLVGAVEGIDLIPSRTGDDHRIDATGADGAQQVFGFFEARLKLFD
jgi:hypothetical protein